MSIFAKRLNETTLQITFTNSEDSNSIENLTLAMRRALNCWPDCHPELKELGDMLDHGKVLQDNYYITRTDLKQKSKQL